jgi:hypothetical protein
MTDDKTDNHPHVTDFLRKNHIQNNSSTDTPNQENEWYQNLPEFKKSYAKKMGERKAGIDADRQKAEQRTEQIAKQERIKTEERAKRKADSARDQPRVEWNESGNGAPFIEDYIQ